MPIENLLMILSGKLKKGKRLYPEKIAQDFDVGYTAVSEAVSRLKRDGLVIVNSTLDLVAARVSPQLVPNLAYNTTPHVKPLLNK